MGFTQLKIFALIFILFLQNLYAEPELKDTDYFRYSSSALTTIGIFVGALTTAHSFLNCKSYNYDSSGNLQSNKPMDLYLAGTGAIMYLTAELNYFLSFKEQIDLDLKNLENKDLSFEALKEQKKAYESEKEAAKEKVMFLSSAALAYTTAATYAQFVSQKQEITHAQCLTEAKLNYAKTQTPENLNCINTSTNSLHKKNFLSKATDKNEAVNEYHKILNEVEANCITSHKCVSYAKIEKNLLLSCQEKNQKNIFGIKFSSAESPLYFYKDPIEHLNPTSKLSHLINELFFGKIAYAQNAASMTGILSATIVPFMFGASKMKQAKMNELLSNPKSRALIWTGLAGIAMSATFITQKSISVLEKNIDTINSIIKEKVAHEKN